MDVVLISGQKIGVIDELLWIGSFPENAKTLERIYQCLFSIPGYDDYPVVPDDGGEVILVPEVGHGEALQEVCPAQQLEGDRALGRGAEVRRQPGDRALATLPSQPGVAVQHETGAAPALLQYKVRRN